MKTKTPRKAKEETKDIVIKLTLNGETKVIETANILDSLNKLEISPRTLKTMLKLDIERNGQHFYKIMNVIRTRLLLGRPILRQMLANQANMALGIKETT